MQVLFNFPNGQAVEFTMDSVPRVGDKVSVSMIKPADFPSMREYEKYRTYDYHKFSWTVENVIWTPAANGKSFANLMLIRTSVYNEQQKQTQLFRPS